MLIQGSTVHSKAGVIYLYLPLAIEIINGCFDIISFNLFLKFSIVVVTRIAYDRRFHSRSALGRIEL